MLDLVGQLTLAVLCAPQFGIYAAVGLDFALELAALITIAVSIGISIPDFVACIALAVGVTIGIDVGVAIGLPSVSVQLGLSINAQLILVLALIATLEGILNIGSAELDAYTYGGTGAGLGSALSGALDAAADVVALVLVATSSGTVAAGSVAGTSLLGGGQGWETSLCSVAFAAPPPGGVRATGTPVLGTISIGGEPTKTVTGITVTNPGAGYDPTKPPGITFSDTADVLGATNASPIVLTLADTTDITTLLVAGVGGNTAANTPTTGPNKGKPWCTKVLSSTTVALYEDPAFTRPVAGNGVWTPATGTVQGNGAGAAAAPVMGGGSKAQIQGFFDGLTFGGGLLSAGSIQLLDILSASFGLFEGLLSELQAEAKALATAKANIGIVPPLIEGNLSIVAGIDATLTAALSAFPPIPSIQANLSAGVSGRAVIVLALLAEIGLQLGFATEKLMVYVYKGAGSGFAPALSTALSSAWPDSTPASNDVDAVVLAATTPAAQAALATFFPAAA